MIRDANGEPITSERIFELRQRALSRLGVECKPAPPAWKMNQGCAADRRIDINFVGPGGTCAWCGCPQNRHLDGRRRR